MRVRVVRLLGVDVLVTPGWLAGFAFVTAALAVVILPAEETGWSPSLTWSVAALMGALFFGSILAHEMAHALAARRLGFTPRAVTLFTFGGSATLDRESERPLGEALVALAGPLASILVGGSFAVLGLVLDTSIGAAAASGANLSLWLAAMNGIIGGVNLVPAFPFDGGRILRAVLWRRGADFISATHTAAAVGRTIGWVGIGVGALVVLRDDTVTGLTIMAVGWFITRFASASQRWAAVQRLVTGLRVGEVMEREAPVVPPNLTLDVFVEQYIASGIGSAFAVAAGGELIGTIDVGRVRRVPRSAWPTRRVEDVMRRVADVETAGEDDPLWPAIERFERERLSLMPVVAGVRLLGVLTREGLLETIHRRARPAER